VPDKSLGKKRTRPIFEQEETEATEGMEKWSWKGVWVVFSALLRSLRFLLFKPSLGGVQSWRAWRGWSIPAGGSGSHVLLPRCREESMLLFETFASFC
jgi:hypothetical protein